MISNFQKSTFHFFLLLYTYFFYIKKKKIKYKSKNIFAMSGVDFLLKLHREGRIDASDIKKALDELQPTTKTVESVQPSVLAKQQRQKYKRLQKAVIDELKQVLSQRKSVSELNLVDKPKCGYFKAYEIFADKYKDPNKLFHDKKSAITQQIVKELKELDGLKFQLALTINFYKDDGAEKKIVCYMVTKWPS